MTTVCMQQQQQQQQQRPSVSSCWNEMTIKKTNCVAVGEKEKKGKECPATLFDSSHIIIENDDDDDDDRRQTTDLSMYGSTREDDYICHSLLTLSPL